MAPCARFSPTMRHGRKSVTETKCQPVKVDIIKTIYNTNPVLIEFETFADAANIGVIFNQIVRQSHNDR